jgi:dGTPase
MGKEHQQARIITEKSRPGDFRSLAEHDHDRILYSSAFLRLAGVAQVAHVADGSLVHNRLTHSLKVGMIAHGLAIRLAREQKEICNAIGGIDAAAAEAAALAHDIGHPPFGHVAEEELKDIVDDAETFEGNAQSFRVVTKLAIRSPDSVGLNLSGATLNGILKYPWFCSTEEKKRKKYGAYRTEDLEFNWARECFERDIRSVEAEIMNWSDDVAYSTHDVEDYYRAGLLPLDRLITSSFEVDRFFAATFERWKQQERNADLKPDDCQIAFERVLTLIKTAFPDDIREPYGGTRRQRAAIHTVSSLLINRFFKGIKLQVPTTENKKMVAIDQEIELEMTMFKELIWHYVIRNPALAMQEYAQKKIIRELFEIFKNEASSNGNVFPQRYREQLIEANDESDPAASKRKVTRVLVDIIAEMTEHQAYETYRRLTGHSAQTVLDHVRR